VLVECADHVDPTDDLVAALGAAADDAVVAVDPGPRAHLLSFRDRITEAINVAGGGMPPFKLDVAVPIRALDELVAVARRAAADDRCDLIVFGHLAEGNLHLNHLGARDTAAIADTVLRAVAASGGTISAEHGIGIAKTAWLHLVRTPGDLAAQAAIKAALDPAGILNPGVLRPSS
jgi:FAD/FMN-containing dehydrogenase